MRFYDFAEFGLEQLTLREGAAPEPGPGEVRVRLQALSLNYRDVLIVKGLYNPRLALPAIPLSDGAGVVSAVGEGVTEWREGDRVMSHFVAGWQSGPFRAEYVGTTLGTPGPGLAAEEVVLPADAVVAIPTGWDTAHAATLPIAALTAWSALVTVGTVQPGDTVLTLGTGGVSIFALQLGNALGARVLVTSSSDDKLARASALGASAGINYRDEPRWDKAVRDLTDGAGVDLVVENGGAGTLSQSLRSVRGGGTIAMLGALTGLRAEIDIAPLVMRRITVAGVMVDSRQAFGAMVDFLQQHPIEPVIGARFAFDQLPDALRHLEQGAHFGKVVIDL